MTRAVMDPIDTQPRCVHDMLDGQCSLCRGLRDVPMLDFSFRDVTDDRSNPLRWVPAEAATECASCHSPIRRAQAVAFSRTFGGNVGHCCEDIA